MTLYMTSVDKINESLTPVWNGQTNIYKLYKLTS